MAAIKKDNKIAEEWLLFYSDRRRQYYADMRSILGAGSYPEVSIRCGVSNPTMAKAIQLTRLMQHEAWLETVEAVEESLSESKRAFLAARREAAYACKQDGPGRPPWIDFVQQRYAEEMKKRCAGRYYVDDNTIRKWWQDLIQLTVRVAIKKNVCRRIKY